MAIISVLSWITVYIGIGFIGLAVIGPVVAGRCLPDSRHRHPRDPVVAGGPVWRFGRQRAAKAAGPAWP